MSMRKLKTHQCKRLESCIKILKDSEVIASSDGIESLILDAMLTTLDEIDRSLCSSNSESKQRRRRSKKSAVTGLKADDILIDNK